MILFFHFYEKYHSHQISTHQYIKPFLRTKDDTMTLVLQKHQLISINRQEQKNFQAHTDSSLITFEKPGNMQGVFEKLVEILKGSTSFSKNMQDGVYR